VNVNIRNAALCAALAVALATGLAACGDDNDATSSDTSTQTAPGSDLSAIKTYLLEHTARLKSETSTLAGLAREYDALAARYDYDHERMLREQRPQVARLVRRLQESFAKANPAYEEMEGVVAGVPSLADYDVIIDAGSDKSDPENAVPFSVKTKDGRVFEQPGNYNYLIETAAYGTDERFAAKGVKPDLDGDGKVEFGEAVPDAQFLTAAADGFDDSSGELDSSAKEWRPTTQDALTALVVMTPTMSEYFNAWKNSRAVAGDKATEKAFVAASRLQDIGDILGGLVLVYKNVEPAIARADAQQARQTGEALRDLHAYAGRLERAEAGGKKFTAQDADSLGTEAQRRAEAIAGQISQAAGKLGIELES
jgi:hypothetical protein